MESVIGSDPGVFLGKTSERLLIRGPLSPWRKRI